MLDAQLLELCDVLAARAGPIVCVGSRRSSKQRHLVLHRADREFRVLKLALVLRHLESRWKRFLHTLSEGGHLLWELHPGRLCLLLREEPKFAQLELGLPKLAPDSFDESLEPRANALARRRHRRAERNTGSDLP